MPQEAMNLFSRWSNVNDGNVLIHNFTNSGWKVTVRDGEEGAILSKKGCSAVVMVFDPRRIKPRSYIHFLIELDKLRLDYAEHVHLPRIHKARFITKPSIGVIVVESCDTACETEVLKDWRSKPSDIARLLRIQHEADLIGKYGDFLQQYRYVRGCIEVILKLGYESPLAIGTIRQRQDGTVVLAHLA